MNIILFGPQGCGKGTQSEMLIKKYKLTHISPGELFRAEVTKGTKIGIKLKDYMDKGILVPKQINLQIVEGALSKIRFQDFILDGFPRNREQAQFLDTIAKIDFAIEISISDEEAIKRISARYACEKCGKGFNTIYKKPKKEGICDHCQGKLVQRDDDKPESVKKRLQIYHEQTAPIKDHYKKVFHKINGEQPIVKVFKDIEKIINA